MRYFPKGDGRTWGLMRRTPGCSGWVPPLRQGLAASEPSATTHMIESARRVRYRDLGESRRPLRMVEGHGAGCPLETRQNNGWSPLTWAIPVSESVPTARHPTESRQRVWQGVSEEPSGGQCARAPSYPSAGESYQTAD